VGVGAPEGEGVPVAEGLAPALGVAKRDARGEPLGAKGVAEGAALRAALEEPEGVAGRVKVTVCAPEGEALCEAAEAEAERDGAEAGGGAD